MVLLMDKLDAHHITCIGICSTPDKHPVFPWPMDLLRTCQRVIFSVNLFHLYYQSDQFTNFRLNRSWICQVVSRLLTLDCLLYSVVLDV